MILWWAYLFSIHASTFHQSFWERSNESQNFMDFGDPSLISTCYFVAFISRAYEPHKPRIPQVSFGKKLAWACLFAYLWKSTTVFGNLGSFWMMINEKPLVVGVGRNPGLPEPPGNTGNSTSQKTPKIRQTHRSRSMVVLTFNPIFLDLFKA